MKVNISEIQVKEGRRKINEGRVTEIAHSISEVGLINPITLTQDYALVAGAHRLEACKRLGWQAIEATIIEATGLMAELAEIDENLMRNDLTEMERSMQIARRKRIYDELYPHTKHGAIGNGRVAKVGNSTPRFTTATSEVTGESERTIYRQVKRGEELAKAPELVQRIEQLPQIANSGAALDELIATPPEKREALLGAIEDGRANSLQEAKREVKKQEREEKRARLSVEVEDTQVNVARVIYKTGDIVEIGNIIALCEDNRSEKARALIDNVGAAFIFCDPPYNAGVADWDGDFVWQQDYLIDLAPIVAVTPGIGNIDTFMRQTAMPYKWSTATFIENGMTRGALGFGNWIYTALFSRESIHRNAQDVWKITINARDGHELGAKRQKPPMYLSYLIDLLSKDGDTIVDAFAGSGIFGIVAQRLNRRAVLIEKNEDTFNAMVQRLIDKQGESE